MPFYLKDKYYRVMASIFKISRGDRHSIHWNDFVHTMKALGYAYSNDKGSKRTFKPRRVELKHDFKSREPKEGQLEPYRQDDMAPKLTAKLGWTASSFKLKE
ncbi:uncharacterized protein TRAVEDRAFT_52741 [Trametes versicolor FP-101664 SS1]|uniref:uncharacterized protein n=1 Tax=Trametes versicolor (strain FP-101664) TaxID=717944 RepID=UPI000462190F|nr:uncharacterized protein TRAVEDRAFT_52741 [Trametes versicolor FP-101664 SS1]EIW53623.1 hypothetical protein TRAVEDRAFT_52741 [Trametes versicolor FP-101664 SS1]